MRRAVESLISPPRVAAAEAAEFRPCVYRHPEPAVSAPTVMPMIPEWGMVIYLAGERANRGFVPKAKMGQEADGDV